MGLNRGGRDGGGRGGEGERKGREKSEKGSEQRKQFPPRGGAPARREHIFRARPR
jgi:hypothetical protein